MNPKNYSGGVPVRLPKELMDDAEEGSKKLDLSKQDTLKLACAIGLAHLKAIDYQVAEVVLRGSPAGALQIAPAPKRRSRKME
jgi:hypothetical protein